MKKSICTFFLTLALMLMSVVGANAVPQLNEDFGTTCSYSSTVQTLKNLGWDTTGYVPGTSSSSSYDYHWRTSSSGIEGCCAYLYAYYYYNTEETLLSPQVTLSSIDDAMLSFQLKNSTAGNSDLDVIVIAGGTTYTIASHINPGNATWNLYELPLAQFKGQSIRVGFKGRSGSSTSYYYYIDDVVIDKAPQCQQPIGLTVSGLSTTSVNLSWTWKGTGYGDVPGSAHVQVVDDATQAVVINDTTENGVTSFDDYSMALTGLQPSTTYTVSVYGDCQRNYAGVSTTSSITFTTLAPALNPPYEESFDALSALPAGSYTMGNVSLNSTSSSAFGNTGKSLKMTVTTSNNAMFITPMINLYADETEIEFQIKSSTSSENIKFSAGYMTDPSDIGTYAPILQDSIYRTSDWQEVRFNTSEMAGYDHTSPIMIAIQIQGGVSASVYVDEILAHVIPTCIRPEGINVSNITSTTADVAWTTSNAANHIIRVQNLSDSTWLTFNAGVSPFTLTNLASNTEYGNLTIQGVCSVIDSSNVKRYYKTFKTFCAVRDSAIFFEGAETTTGSNIPECWLMGVIREGSGNGSVYSNAPFYTQTSTMIDSRGFQLRDMKAGTISYLISQPIDFEQAGKYTFRYQLYRGEGTGTLGEGIKIFVTPVAGDTTNAIQVIPFVDKLAGNPPVGASGWNEYEGIINYGGVGYIMVVGYSKYVSSTYFDNLEVLLTPSCPKVSGLTTSNVTSNSVNISWNRGANETEWLLSYELKQGNTTIDMQTVNVTGQTSYTLNGLQPATAYTLTASVRAYCQVGDTSEVVTMPSISFTTACSTISTFPYRENFEGFAGNTIPACWSNAASTATASYPYYIWGVYSQSGGNKSIRMYNYYVHAGEAVTDMPQFALLNVPMVMTFDYSHTADCGDMNVQISTDGITYATVASFSKNQTSTSYTDPGTFSPATVDLSTYAGQTINIRFRAVANWSAGAIWVDNIVVRALPTCPDVDAIIGQVDGTTAVVNLDTTINKWQISLGMNPGDSIIDVVGANTFTLTGLTPTTTYRLYVRSNCDTSYGDWSAGHTFTTTKLCPDLTAVISEVTSTSAIVTKENIAGAWQISLGVNPGDSIIDVTTGNTYTLTNLNPEYSYVVRVRKNCDSLSMYGDWSEAYLFTTPSLPATLPFVCDFEDPAESTRWSFVDGAGANVFTIGTNTNAVYAGANALYVTNDRTSGTYTYSTDSATRAYAFRTIHFESKGYQVNFKFKVTGGEGNWDFGRIFLTNATTALPAGEVGSSYSSTTFPTTVAEFDGQFLYSGSNPQLSGYTYAVGNPDANGWVSVSYFLDMTTKAEGDYNFVVMWSNDGSSGNQSPLAVDNINIYELTCIPPSTVLVNDLTPNSANLYIQQNDVSQWEVLVSETTFTSESLPETPAYRAIVNTPVVSLTGLTANTDYYYSVRAICGANDTSDWKTINMFHTYCAAVNVPMQETFETASSTNCWSNGGESGSVSRSTSYRRSGTASMRIEAATAVTPEFIADSLTGFMINGWCYATSDSVDFAIGVVADPNDPASSFEPLTTVVVPVSYQWTEFTSYFTALLDEAYDEVGDYDFRHAKYIAIATGENTIYFDDLTIDYTPTCPKPTETLITNVGAHSFDISFTDNANASSWVISINGNKQTITTNPVTITGLNASTSYNVEIAALCSATDTSYYTNVGTVTTACDNIIPPYSEDFSSHTVDAVPNCWDNSLSTTTPLSALWTICNASGNKMIRVNDYYANSGQATLTSPLFVLNAGEAYAFEFDYCYAASDIDNVTLAISTDNGTTWTTLANLPSYGNDYDMDSDPQPDVFTHYSYDLSTYAGNNVMFKFECTTDYQYGGVFVDNISVRALLSCSDPGTPVASNITATSANIQFTDTCAAHTQWQYVAGVAGFNPANATPVTVDTNAFTLTGLADDSNISVYVRAYCGAGDTSNWVSTTFRTLCTPFTVTATTPFVEDFEGFSYGDRFASSCYSMSTSSSSYYYAVAYPSSDPSTSTYSYRYIYSHDGIEQNKCLYAYYSQYYAPNGFFMSRQLHLEAGNTYEFSAWVLAASYPVDFTIKAGLNNMSAQLTTVASASLQSISVSSQFDPMSGNYYYHYDQAYRQVKGIFTPDSTADYEMRLSATYAAGNSDMYFYMDDIQVRQFEGCAPSVVAIDSITATRVCVDIADSDPTHTYEYVLNDTTAATTTVATNHFAITNLTTATVYTLYVRTYCDESSYSEWMEVPFTTACGIISEFPYVLNFESFEADIVPTCWDNTASTSSTLSSNPSRIWGVYEYSGNKMLRMHNFYVNSGTAVIETPTFSLPAEPVELSFDYSHLANCGTFNVMISANNGVSYSNIGSYNAAAASYDYTDPGTFYHVIIDLSAYAGQNVKFKLSAVANYGSGAIFFDNMAVTYIPACREPDNAPTITGTTMTTISVRASMAGKSAIEFGVAPYSTGVTTADIIDSVASTDGNAVITNLTGLTRYAVWYRYICDSATVSDWSKLSSTAITMASDCFDPQNIHTGIVDDHSATISWGAAPEVSAYQYQLYVGNSAATGTLVDSSRTTIDTVVYNNLTSLTNYFFRVRGFCSGDTTAWVNLSFTTTRAAATLPFICGFENASDAALWETDATASSANMFAIGTATNNGGSNAIYVSNDGGSTFAYSTGTASQAFARILIPFTAGNYLVSYDYISNGESGYDYGRIFLYPAVNAVGTMSNSDLKTAQVVGDLEISDAQLQGKNSWNSVQYVVSVPADAMYYLQLNWANDGSVGNQYPLAVDNIHIEELNCMPLTSVNTVTVNATNAKFNAVRYEAGLDIQYGYSLNDDVDAITWTTIQGTGLTDDIILTGLTPNTQYYLFVRELCDSASVSSATRVAFQTPGTAQSIPFVCSFESNESTTNVWSFANSSTNGFVVGSETAYTGANALYISDDGGTYQYAASPTCDSYAYVPLIFGDGTYDIEYSWNCYGESSYDYGRLYLAPGAFIPTADVMVSGIGTTGTPAGWIALDGDSKMNQVQQWQTVLKEVSFTDSTTMNLVVFWHNDGSVDHQPPLAIDDISITKQTCPSMKMDSITADTIAETFFTLRYYNPNEGAQTLWIVSTNSQCTDTVATGIEPSTSRTFTATGLSASTNYHVFLYSICDVSDRSRALHFTCRTKCAVMTQFPYDEGFETFEAGYYNLLTGACWLTTTMTSDLYAVAYTSDVHSGAQALYVDNGYYGGTQILALPEMSNLNGKTLSFWYMAGGTSSYYNKLTFGYLNSSNQFVSLLPMSNVTSWQQYSNTISNLPAGVTRLAFKFAGEYEYYLDDIHINDVVQGNTYYDTICHGAAYNAHGFNIAAGRLADGDTVMTRTIPATSAGVADSITTLNIFVRPEIVNATYDTICQGTTSYNKNGWTITNPTTRTYSQSFTAACGCDSTVALILYVQPTQVTLFDTICQGASYQFGNMNLTQTGVYHDTVASGYGCDITRTLNLFVADTATHLYDQTCVGSSYTWEGQVYNQPGTYTHTATGPGGCPMTKYLHLTMTPTDSICNVSFCRGGSIQVADTIIKNAGTYTFVRVNALTGCNTTYHVTATETAPIPEYLNDEACEGKPYYGFGVSGVIITKDTVITQNTRTWDGLCDSVVIANVKLNKTSYGAPESMEIGEGETYTWNENTYSVSGTYHATLTDVNGCDSICTLYLKVGTGVENVELMNISLIPNPVNAGETSFIYGDFTDVKSVEILNSFGQVIDTFVPQTYPIEVQGINASGIYYVRVTTEDEKVAVQKLIVK